MRIKHKVNVRISSDSAGKNILFGPDDALAEVTIDDFVAQASTHVRVAAGVKDELPLGDLDAIRGCYLEVAGNCNVYVNSSLTPIPLTLPTSGTKAKLFLEAAITKIELEAGATVQVDGIFCVWGATA